ncbi:host attachment protein [Caballeronia sp. LZ019]|uniref:host attachment protein n=1 Tax=Caballeronia sp. LZ019 TaxID=3038555 RepID=UPI00285E746D|nr:host attachment protein [Caballeronia sp. LZ019]MDR5808205.1 host attachment protein [Caballeronia sp. LZ019]
MTAITWVLAADGRRARIFETRGLALDLQQVEDIRNPALQAADSIDKGRDSFAKALASFLEESRLRHRFDRLRLAVEPEFLGALRERLSSETLKLVYEARSNEVSNVDVQDARR